MRDYANTNQRQIPAPIRQVFFGDYANTNQRMTSAPNRSPFLGRLGDESNPTNDELTLASVIDGSAYRMLKAKQSALLNQGADILAKLLQATDTNQKDLLQQALAANENAKASFRDATAHYNVLAEAVSTYSSYKPYKLDYSTNPAGTSGSVWDWLGLKGMGNLGVIPAGVYAVVALVIGVAGVATAIYSFGYAVSHVEQWMNSAANLVDKAGAAGAKVISEARQIPKDITAASSQAVDTLGKLGLYAGLGFAAYLAYQALKKRGNL